MAFLIPIGALIVDGIMEDKRHRREMRAYERAENARREAERVKEQAVVQRQEAERAREQAERERQEAEERAEQERRRRVALEQLMQDLGMDPSMTEVSEEDITSARRDINYEPGAKNIVIAGNLNAGKSSLINALRNCVIANSAYAPTGASETTMSRHRYPDPIHQGYIWYDTPGAGTVNVTAFGYYYNQRLFAYDIVVLAHESSLTENDIRLLQVCRLLNQPVIVARTKCDMHIRNYQDERGWTADLSRTTFLGEVREDVRRFVAQTRLSEAAGVEAGLEDLVISAPGVRCLVRGERSPTDPARAYVDEVKFLHALGI